MANKKLADALNEEVNVSKTIKCSATTPIEYTDTVWEDLRIVPSAFDFAGSADPNLVSWQPGGSGTTFKAWEFAPSDEAFFTMQLPHAWKEGTDLKCHIHWTPQKRGNEENGKTVAWKLNYSWANRDAAFVASAVIDMTDACSGTDHLHEMSVEATITGAGKTISSMMICRIFRDAGDTWATNTTGNLPLLLEVDFHYQIDVAGSVSSTSKS